jgi:hypothetical protein
VTAFILRLAPDSIAGVGLQPLAQTAADLVPKGRLFAPSVLAAQEQQRRDPDASPRLHRACGLRVDFALLA